MVGCDYQKGHIDGPANTPSTAVLACAKLAQISLCGVHRHLKHRLLPCPRPRCIHDALFAFHCKAGRSHYTVQELIFF